MFVMWRTTRDVKWRERGWGIWTSIENVTRTFSGYASIADVDTRYPIQLDSMPRWAMPTLHCMLLFLISVSDVVHHASYFLSETIKYAYLLAIDRDPWPMDKYVFNTEAHPLPIFS